MFISHYPLLFPVPRSLSHPKSLCAKDSKTDSDRKLPLAFLHMQDLEIF